MEVVMIVVVERGRRWIGRPGCGKWMMMGMMIALVGDHHLG